MSYHRINVEGVNAIEWFAPTDQTKFATATRTVNVCDGRLTIDAKSGINTKLNYVDVRHQDEDRATLVGDTGSDATSCRKVSKFAWDDTRGYGWVREDSLSTPSHTPLNITSNLADRDPYETNGYSRRRQPRRRLCGTGKQINRNSRRSRARSRSPSRAAPTRSP